MSRNKHQFHPGLLEVFETRVVPSTIVGTQVETPLPIQTSPFVPPGQVQNYSNAAGTATFSVDANNVLTFNVTGATTQYVTFTIYSAPGGGDSDLTVVDPDYNLSSQTLIWSKTVEVVGGAATSTVDLDDLKLTGQRKLQCDAFATNDACGYAPKKPFEKNLDGYLISGQLFDYSEIDARGRERR